MDFKDTFDTLKDKATDLAQAGVAQSKRLAEIAKLKMSNMAEEDAIKKAYIEIGKLYYAEQGASPDGAFAAACEKITASKAAIESNIERALQMADKSALSYYKVLQEKGFFNRLIAGNISQMVKVDSIRCDFDRYPYEVTTYARQRILRESTVTERSLVTTCRLVNTSRSDNNPQGFMVEALNIVENKDIATYDR